MAKRETLNPAAAASVARLTGCANELSMKATLRLMARDIDTDASPAA
ncbi:hypothetical protein [Paraburkholderia sp.]